MGNCVSVLDADGGQGRAAPGGAFGVAAPAEKVFLLNETGPTPRNILRRARTTLSARYHRAASSSAKGAAAAPQAPAAGSPSRLIVSLLSGRFHDSARSIASAPARRLAPRRRPGGPSDAAGPEPVPAAAAAAAVSAPGKKQRLPALDLSTGQAIPDFGVDGVFDVLQLLGAGGSGSTYLCRDLATRELVAVKFMDRPLPKLAVPLLMREVELQACLGQGHPNVVHAHELVLTESHLALVLEFAAGGALTDMVAGRWESALERGGLHLTEEEARYFFRQFVEAVAYCHENRVAHRDLKLDNTLLDGTAGAPPRVKLCDFGFARTWGNCGSGDMHTALGTPAYMSPQLLGAKYGHQGFDGAAADVWASGVMLYVMLLGSFPFDHDKHNDPNCDEAHLEVRMAQEKLSWRDHPRARAAMSKGVLSAEVADLLDKLLTMDEAKRIDSQGILAHPWLQGPLPSDAHEEARRALQAECQERMAACGAPRAAAQLKRLKEATLAMMAAATRPASEAPLRLPSDEPPRRGDWSARRGGAAAAGAAAPDAAAPAAAGDGGSGGDRSGRDGGGGGGGDVSGGADRPWRRPLHESTPSIAQLCALQGAPAGRASSDLGAAPAPAAGPAPSGGGSAAAGGAGGPTRLETVLSVGSLEDCGEAPSSGSGSGSGDGAVGEPALSPAVSSDLGSSNGGAGASGKPPVRGAAAAVSAPSASHRLPPWGVQDAREQGGGLVWRLPLVVWAPDEALAIPLPDFQVLSGALLKQLQQGGRAKPAFAPSCKRMSWPMAGGAQPTSAGLCSSPLDGL